MSVQTPVLPPGGTYVGVLWQMFGNSMFPEFINAPNGPVKLLSQDGLLHGNIIPLMLRAIGNSITSFVSVQPSN